MSDQVETIQITVPKQLAPFMLKAVEMLLQRGEAEHAESAAIAVGYFREGGMYGGIMVCGNVPEARSGYRNPAEAQGSMACSGFVEAIAREFGQEGINRQVDQNATRFMSECRKLGLDWPRMVKPGHGSTLGAALDNYDHSQKPGDEQ